MDIVLYVLAIIVGGLFVGAIARFIIPGPDPMSILQTMLVGVAGSIAAGLITYYAFDREGTPGILLSVLCAAILVFVIRKVRERQLGPQASRSSPLGEGTQFGGTSVRVASMPGCLITSIVLSIGLTILLNLLIRAF
jgi:uncharacterized membrane protein YeaQ/YmgE (transglycosylase-associated protein family)